MPTQTNVQGGTSTWNNDTLPYWFNFGSKNSAYPGMAPNGALFNLLQNPGQTDTYMLNRNLLENSRSTASSQDAARAMAAQRGYGSSPLGAALQSAIGQAGANQRSDIIGKEGRRREDLLRQDLGFLYDFIVQPELTTYGANKGVSVAQSAQRQQQQGAWINAIGGLIGGLIGLCRTAEELYGVNAEETNYARAYMALMADSETRSAYGTGAELAEAIRHDPELRSEVRTIFDGFVAEAKTALGG